MKRKTKEPQPPNNIETSNLYEILGEEMDEHMTDEKNKEKSQDNNTGMNGKITIYLNRHPQNQSQELRYQKQITITKHKTTKTNKTKYHQ